MQSAEMESWNFVSVDSESFSLNSFCFIRHRVSSRPKCISNQRVQCRVGRFESLSPFSKALVLLWVVSNSVQSCVSLSLHIKMAYHSIGVPVRYVFQLRFKSFSKPARSDNREWDFQKYGDGDD